jgi:hypothetical protein
MMAALAAIAFKLVVAQACAALLIVCAAVLARVLR